MARPKETTRQRLIGMMYLVLLALLALNVSNEVLDAFKTVKDGIETTTKTTQSTIDDTMRSFAKAMDNDKEKAQPFFLKAIAAQKSTRELFAYIEQIKELMIAEANGLNEETGDIRKRENTVIPGRIMIDNIAGKAYGPELRKKIDSTRAFLLSLVDTADLNVVNLVLSTQKPLGSDVTQTWESSMFEYKPVTAAVTLLSKLQNDVKNSEAEILRYLLRSVYESDFKFDVLEAAVVPNSNFVLVGQPYEADIFVTASSSTQQPEVEVNGQAIPVEGGKGKYRITPNREGVFSFKGVAKVKAPDGSISEYPFEKSYQVGAPVAVVSAEKMNVLYIGVDNPMSISVPGIPKDKLRVSLSEGSLVGSAGNYVARVSNPGRVRFNVSGEVNGQFRQLGSKEFRVRRVPPPLGKFGGITSGSLSAAVAKVQPGVFAELENFDFDLSYTVTRFTITIARRGQDPYVETIAGNALSARTKQVLNTVAARDIISIDDIFVRGPSGVEKLPTGITVRIQ